MKAKVTIYPRARKALLDAQIGAVSDTSEKLRAEAIDTQVIPLQSGNLQNVATTLDKSDIKKGSVTIETNTVYARRLYYHPEYKFDKTFNKHARGLWWEPWLRGNKKKLPPQWFAIFLKMRGGDLIK